VTTTYRPADPIWCAGCGHFGVQAAIARGLQALELAPHDVIVLAGIGCSGTIQNNLGTYGYHALHGRVLPTAAGVRLANPDLTVIAAGGDGDGYAIGVGHLVHALNRDLPFLYVVMNNGIYGLTKGQDSPTKPHDGRPPLDAVDLALSIPATGFIARGFARWSDQLNRLIEQALRYTGDRRGFAFVEVLSPCVTYNDTYAEWEASLHDVDADPNHDPTDRPAAHARSAVLRSRGSSPVGLIYHDQDRSATPAVEQSAPAAEERRTAYRTLRDRYAV